MRIFRLVFFLIAIFAGIAAGLYFGWVLSPPKPGESALAELRPDYRTDYALMVAEAFQSDGDVTLAMARLSFLGAETPARLAQEAILSARELNYSNDDVDMMAKLSQALLNWNPSPVVGTASPAGATSSVAGTPPAGATPSVAGGTP